MNHDLLNKCTALYSFNKPFTIDSGMKEKLKIFINKQPESWRRQAVFDLLITDQHFLL
ncbi:hypothetical protein [Peribacillus deserti]|uniref:hypothetical protein n=1 Tax=Peribacillus deserti TaxID=673318 RepID=UPI0015E0CA35|nr:hypothetical protein [Peribacillus deserti]